MEIRELRKDEFKEALDLVLDVFMKFEAPDYSVEGVESFKKSIKDKNWLNSLRIFGSYIDNTLSGVIASRNNGNHVALFFVKEEFHKLGIGRRLFERVVENSTENSITVNSSPYAVEIYEHLGFEKVKEEQEEQGIKYTPMIFKKN